jgi:hypothetical protein
MKREEIERNFYRIRVPFGWILEVWSDVSSPVYTGYYTTEYKEGYEWRISVTFIFDPFHLWKIK